MLTPAELAAHLRTSERTALYRHWDAAGALLYVGISLGPIHRLAAHARGSCWADLIAKVTIEWFPSRAHAIAAEGAAILDENPPHNIAGRGPASKTKSSASLSQAPRAPRYAISQEHLAVHFGTSTRTVARMVREGMPREQLSPKCFRFEIGACEDWALGQAEAAALESIMEVRERASSEQAVLRGAMSAAFEEA